VHSTPPCVLAATKQWSLATPSRATLGSIDERAAASAPSHNEAGGRGGRCVLAARVGCGVRLVGFRAPSAVLVLEHLLGATVCGAIRAVCSTWGSILNALVPRPNGLAKLDFPSVDGGGAVDENVSGVLAELGSMPSLRSLSLPSSCAQKGDAGAYRDSEQPAHQRCPGCGGSPARDERADRRPDPTAHVPTGCTHGCTHGDSVKGTSRLIGLGHDVTRSSTVSQYRSAARSHLTSTSPNHAHAFGRSIERPPLSLSHVCCVQLMSVDPPLQASSACAPPSAV
jgi:hypothetical protein